MSFLNTLLHTGADVCCLVLICCACLQLAWQQKDQDMPHSPGWWKEAFLPLGAAYMFAWHGNGAGEGFVLWLSLLAPCVLATALFMLMGKGSRELCLKARNTGFVLFVPAVFLLLFV